MIIEQRERLRLGGGPGACLVLAAGMGLSFALAGLVLADASAEGRVAADVRFLASDELEGRGVGTPGLERAADYIGAEFRKAGLQVPGDLTTYYQALNMTVGAELGKPNELALAGPSGEISLVVDRDFRPTSFGGQGAFSGPVVFAGYGITAPDAHYDDYAGIEAKGKVVLVMRQEPHTQDPHDAFEGNQLTRHSDLRNKAANAAQHGAAALLLVSDPTSLKEQARTAPSAGGASGQATGTLGSASAADALLKFGYGGWDNPSSMPIVHITREAADRLLKASAGTDLAALESEIDKKVTPHTVPLEGWQCRGVVSIVRRQAEVKNVIGVLEGSGPRANETIVVGAHYDHLGRGAPGSLAPDSHEIHHGADDNASGTAAVVELARRLGRREKPLPRRIVLVAFTGEEAGLVGSAHYVRHPVVPLEQTAAMVNLDMVGRLKDDKLTVFGTATAKEFPALLDELGRKRGLKIQKNADGFGPSDHSSFYGKNIPVLHLFTGTHSDYHRPSDTADKVNLAGLARVCDFLEDLVTSLATREARVQFVQAPASPQRAAARSGDMPSLGTVPDYAQEVEGVALSGVRAGGPADKAGIKGGDVIIRLGEKPIKNIYDYTYALRALKPGQKVAVVVRRGDKELKLEAMLGQPQGR